MLMGIQATPIVTVERWAWQGITDVNKDTALLSQSKNIKRNVVPFEQDLWQRIAILINRKPLEFR
jgi:hypothetical protein